VAKPEFRNPDKFQVLPFREWIRKNLPTGNEGVTIEDLDLVVRVYGNQYGSDGQGKFMLIELKFDDSWIGYAQMKTFRLIDKILKAGDAEGNRYKGYFVLQYTDENWDQSTFTINRIPITKTDLIKFFLFDNEILKTIPSIF